MILHSKFRNSVLLLFALTRSLKILPTLRFRRRHSTIAESANRQWESDPPSIDEMRSLKRNWWMHLLVAILASCSCLGQGQIPQEITWSSPTNYFLFLNIATRCLRDLTVDCRSPFAWKAGLLKSAATRSQLFAQGRSMSSLNKAATQCMPLWFPDKALTTQISRC